MFIGLFLLASLMLTIPLVEARTSQHLHRHVRQAADAPDAYILVADRVMSDDAVVYYLHPLVSSTEHPVTQPVSIVYDSKLSILVFNTTGPLTSDQSLASFAVNDNGNTPLIISETTPTMDFFTLDLNTFKTSSVGSIQGGLAEFISPNWFTYVKSLDQYWLVEMMNGPGPYSVLSLYADPIKDGKVTFSTQLAPIGEMGDQHITSDSANQLLYISIFVDHCTAPGHCDPPRGQLVTFDIKTQSVVYNASCTAPMRVRYSPSRKTLFATTLQENNSGYLQPASIVEVDPATCKTRVLIDKLTPTAGEELLDAFNDVTGEWYFTWYTFWDQQILSSFYSINIDTKKITSPVSFLYNTSEVAVAGITTFMGSK